MIIQSLFSWLCSRRKNSSCSDVLSISTTKRSWRCQDTKLFSLKLFSSKNSFSLLVFDDIHILSFEWKSTPPNIFGTLCTKYSFYSIFILLFFFYLLCLLLFCYHTMYHNIIIHRKNRNKFFIEILFDAFCFLFKICK